MSSPSSSLSTLTSTWTTTTSSQPMTSTLTSQKGQMKTKKISKIVLNQDNSSSDTYFDRCFTKSRWKKSRLAGCLNLPPQVVTLELHIPGAARCARFPQGEYSTAKPRRPKKLLNVFLRQDELPKFVQQIVAAAR